MKPVALIGHDAVETFGHAPAILGEGLDVVTCLADRSPLPRLDDVSAIVVFGGEMNVDQTDLHPFLAVERELVRQALDEGVPLLGICLGAQMLARALDEPVYRAPVKEIGFGILHLTEGARSDPLLSVFDDGDMVFHWHEDTFDLPPGATLLATGDDVQVQAYRVGERAWGLQFHFEVDRDELDLWFRDAGPEHLAAWGKPEEELRAEVDRHLASQAERARGVFLAFAGVVRGMR